MKFWIKEKFVFLVALRKSRSDEDYKMKICYENQKYKVSIRDWIYILFHNVVLKLKRCKRRFNVVFPNRLLILNLFVTGLWIVYSVLVLFFGKIYIRTEYGLLDVLWDIKEGYFTSVIFTVAVSALSNIKEYKEKLSSQYYMYLETMSDFESIFIPFLDNKIQYFMPFYTRNVLQITLEKIVIDKNCAKRFLHESLDVILKRINLLQENIKSNKIILCDTDSLMRNCEDAIENIKELRLKNMVDYENIEEISNILYKIIDRIRNPWRWDIQRKVKILNCLSKYPEIKIKDDFYYRMLLDDFNIDELN